MEKHRLEQSGHTKKVPELGRRHLCHISPQQKSSQGPTPTFSTYIVANTRCLSMDWPRLDVVRALRCRCGQFQHDHSRSAARVHALFAVLPAGYSLSPLSNNACGGCISELFVYLQVDSGAYVHTGMERHSKDDEVVLNSGRSWNIAKA